MKTINWIPTPPSYDLLLHSLHHRDMMINLDLGNCQCLKLGRLIVVEFVAISNGTTHCSSGRMLITLPQRRQHWTSCPEPCPGAQKLSIKSESFSWRQWSWRYFRSCSYWWYSFSASFISISSVFCSSILWLQIENIRSLSEVLLCGQKMIAKMFRLILFSEFEQLFDHLKLSQLWLFQDAFEFSLETWVKTWISSRPEDWTLLFLFIGQVGMPPAPFDGRFRER